MGYVFIMNFIYIIMIMLIYFSKKRVDNLDNKIYSTILVLNSVGVVVDILQFILIKNSAPTNVKMATVDAYAVAPTSLATRSESPNFREAEEHAQPTTAPT